MLQRRGVLNCCTTPPTLVKASVGKSHDRCETNETQEWISHCNDSFSSVCSMQNKMSIESIFHSLRRRHSLSRATYLSATQASTTSGKVTTNMRLMKHKNG